jgi:DNA-binding transcriptional MerR regulator
MSAPARAYLSIGEVLGKLRGEFPDVTISKIRFLESEGLIQPQRTPSGYRKFSHHDVDRLRYVLGTQRDHYLPLKVIKDHLDALDRGLQPPALAGHSAIAPRVATVDGEKFFGETSDVKLSRSELLESSQLNEHQLTELESYGLIQSTGKHYDSDALAIARAVAEVSAYGIEARHLRPFKIAAEREIGLIEQVITPLLRQKGGEARARAEEVERQLGGLTLKIHAALVRSGLRHNK